MEIESISEIAKFGMTFDRMRLEAAAQNIALANVAFSSAIEAQDAAQKVANKMLVELERNNVMLHQDVEVAIKKVNDSSHPLADANGDVFYIDVDPTREMATLVSALRNYEANVRAFNTNGEMNAAALQIGGGK